MQEKFTSCSLNGLSFDIIAFMEGYNIYERKNVSIQIVKMDGGDDDYFWEATVKVGEEPLPEAADVFAADKALTAAAAKPSFSTMNLYTNIGQDAAERDEIANKAFQLLVDKNPSLNLTYDEDGINVDEQGADGEKETLEIALTIEFAEAMKLLAEEHSNVNKNILARLEGHTHVFIDYNPTFSR